MHFWDLTCLPNAGSSASCGFAATQSGADASSAELESQNAAGTVQVNTQLLGENLSAVAAAPFRKSLHEWSHIKLNLYGVRNRATKWSVDVIMIKDQFADFFAAAANTEKRKLYDALIRSYMFNNLNIGDPQTRADIKVLKSFEVIIDPITTDQVGGATAIPRIQTVNWFMKHNRMRLYDWRRIDTPPLLADAQWDQETTAGNDIRVHPGSRVYLVIRAMSPSRREVAGITPMNAPDVATEPSYDLVIRQKHWFTQ